VIGFDTNILLRILLQDDVTQLTLVDQQLSQLAAIGERAYICLPVFTETVFVLRRVKKLAKADVCAAMRHVLNTAAFVIEHSDELLDALDHWEKGNAGFNDYLIGAINHHFGCRQTSTFDAVLVAEQPGRFQSPPGIAFPAGS
jgi:predicted nucleic-acid-binding protein